MKLRKAVIPAAGLGTRFLPATKAQPKEMLPLIDKPAIQYVVEEAVRADLTISFGTVKRGHLVARGACGTVVVVDIGLGAHVDADDGAPLLVDDAWVRARVPRIAANAHKGSRRRVVIAGGDRGMAGAQVIVSAVYDRLLRFQDADQIPEPDLAAAMPEQPDPTTYVFTIQEGAKFHNKAPVNGRVATAADVVWSLDRARTPDNPLFIHRSLMESIDKIEAPDAKTVRITTTPSAIPSA